MKPTKNLPEIGTGAFPYWMPTMWDGALDIKFSC